MKKVSLFFVAFAIGILSSFMYERDGLRPGETANISVFRTFKYMGGGTFMSPGGQPRYADDCIGCGPMGDVNVYHNTERNAENTLYTLNANCGQEANGDVIETGNKLDTAGQVIGKRCIVVMGKEPRIFWTERDEYFIIGAPTIALAVEFESSDAFRMWKSAR